MNSSIKSYFFEISKILVIVVVLIVFNTRIFFSTIDYSKTLIIYLCILLYLYNILTSLCIFVATQAMNRIIEIYFYMKRRYGNNYSIYDK